MGLRNLSRRDSALRSKVSHAHRGRCAASRTARDSAYSVEKAPDEISATGGHRLLSPRPHRPTEKRVEKDLTAMVE